MDDQLRRELAALRAELQARISELERISAAAMASRAPVKLDQASVGRLSRMDAIQGQSMALETERRRVIERARIADAIKRIDAGEYGNCTKCGEPIPKKRLDLDPATPTCVACAR